MSTTAPEQFEFQTEARQLLDLMIHSVYSHPEIFLRELISNASDAIDKLRYEALTDKSLPAPENPCIRLTPDAEARTLTIEDNGIGMNRDEVIKYIGTIAKSGTREFAAAVKEAKKSGLPEELIGQFGIGFYSSFIVADKVTLVTRRAGTDEAWRWESTGDGKFTLEPAERDSAGTSITLHLKPADEEDEQHQDFTAEWTLKQVVRKYSDFVQYPILMQVSRTETPRDEDGKPKEGAEPVTTIKDETLNSMKAIWTRAESEVTEEEYQEFYKHVSHDWNEPLMRIRQRAEGTTEYRALMFIPSKAPYNLFMRDAEDSGIHLYIKRVFIMNDCKELIPTNLRFVRGIVDSEDLSLNISREILQQDRTIARIRKGLTRKIYDELKKFKSENKEQFLTFWKEFGQVVKEGLTGWDAKDREPILDVALFNSTAGDELTTLDEYIDRMKDSQDTIYYLTGDSLVALKGSPLLEAFRDRNLEVLLLNEPVDEIWAQYVSEHKGKKLKAIDRGDIELDPVDGKDKETAEADRKEKAEAFKDLFGVITGRLGEYIREVRFSNRLTSSPACLVTGENDMNPQMEAMMRAMGQDVPKTKRILELNPNHAIVEKLKAAYEAHPNDEQVKSVIDVLYGQAVLSEGGQLPDPAAFSRSLTSILEKAV